MVIPVQVGSIDIYLGIFLDLNACFETCMYPIVALMLKRKVPLYRFNAAIRPAIRQPLLITMVKFTTNKLLVLKIQDIYELFCVLVAVYYILEIQWVFI